MARFRLPKSVQELADWYMRYVSPASLVAGVIADNLVLAKRVDLFLTNALLLTYLVVAALAITLFNLIETGRLRHRFLLAVLPLLPVVVQFAFGGLFSAYFSLYSRSADIAASWIFVALVVVLIVGNERFAHFYARYAVQLSIYFFVLFSFLIFFLPVIFHQIGPLMFVFSGAIALLIITLFLYLLERLVPEVAAKDRTLVARIIAVIFLVFNVLYFTNSIPPLPLALKDAGVYHQVNRVGDDYHLLGEAVPWYERFLSYNTTIHLAPGEAAYAFTSVFAPSGLSTTVLHQWQHYDTASRGWITTNVVRFPVHGGRDGGYRGYSLKTNPETGEWRINVLTQYGQLIGRVSFDVAPASTTPTLQESVH